jgi:hypothetical protein
MSKVKLAEVCPHLFRNLPNLLFFPIQNDEISFICMKNQPLLIVGVSYKAASEPPSGTTMMNECR